jgi:hypothetical protein
VNNSPINFSDPSGHSTECGIGDPYCQAGELNVVKRAQDLAVDNKREESLRGSRVYWAGLSHEERSILSEGGFDEGAYNDYLDDDTRNATMLEDPAFYVSLAIGGGVKLINGLLAGGGQGAGNTGLTMAQALGRAGESASGIQKNYLHIPSLTDTASYRIPDQLLPDLKLITEVKNVAYQGYTNQLKDFVQYAQQNGYTFELIVRQATILSQQLQAAINDGLISLKYLPLE